MFPSTDVTVPEPVPVLVIVRLFCGAGTNVAVAAAADVPTMIEQVEVPVQSPVHPANTEPVAGAAVNTIVEPVLMLAEHEPGQLIPPTLLVTEPVPVPAIVTLTGNAVGIKVALTDCAEFMVTTHAPAPEHAPLQPLKTAPA